MNNILIIMLLFQSHCRGIGSVYS